MRHHSPSYYAIAVPRIPKVAGPDRIAPKCAARVPRGLRLVTAVSTQQPRRAMYMLARNFKREFEFSGVQWGHDGREDDENARGFLFVDNGADAVYAVGATCFRWRHWTDHAPGWAMQWVWLHPFARRQGLLTGAWPFFRQEFGDFFVEPPVSPAMKAFVAKMRAAATPVDPTVTASVEHVTSQQ